MKQKKTILLCCIAVMLLAIIGTGSTLFLGCDSVGSPDDTHRDTATGDQIIEDTSPDRETVSSTEDSGTEPDAVETDEEKNPEDSAESVTDEPDTESEDTTAEASATEPDPLGYEEYNAMSAEEQEAFFLSFNSPEDFFAWYNAAKEKYLEENPGIEIGPDGIIPIP